MIYKSWLPQNEHSCIMYYEFNMTVKNGSVIHRFKSTEINSVTKMLKIFMEIELSAISIKNEIINVLTIPILTYTKPKIFDRLCHLHIQ